MLVLFFLRPHICATASDWTKRKTPVSLSSQRRRVGLKAESFSKSLMNSHKWFPFEAKRRKKIRFDSWKWSLHCGVYTILRYYLIWFFFSAILTLANFPSSVAFLSFALLLMFNDAAVIWDTGGIPFPVHRFLFGRSNFNHFFVWEYTTQGHIILTMITSYFWI